MKNYHTLLGTVIFCIIAVAVTVDLTTLDRLKRLEMHQAEQSRSIKFLVDYAQAIDTKCRNTHAKYTQLDLDTREAWMRKDKPEFIYHLDSQNDTDTTYYEKPYPYIRGNQ